MTLPLEAQRLGPGLNHEASGRTHAFLQWLIVFAIWTTLALLSACQSALALAHVGEPVPWRGLLIGRLVDWYTCAAFTPVFFWLVRRYPVDGRRWLSSLSVLLATTGTCVVIKYLVYTELRVWINPGAPRLTLSTALAGNFIIEMIIFWVVLAVIHAIELARRAHAHAMQAARLQAELAQARLDALAAQLHPHFLFNTLHGISTLMHRDVDAADTMLTHLSDLLRRTLERGDRHEVPLSEELDMLRTYLAIIQVRFGERLVVEVEAGPDTADALVPRFIFQPLVENALQHGIARRAGAGRIQIRALRAGDTLQLTVSDDGPGIARGDRGAPREGIGLSNTRRRLQELYGDAQRLGLDGASDGGLSVSVVIPFRWMHASERSAGAAYGGRRQFPDDAGATLRAAEPSGNLWRPI